MSRHDACLPPSGLPGLDPAWSRLVTTPDADGVPRTFHVLDNGADPVVGTMLCVHGNPTWSYLWRRFLAAAPPGWRVVAPDHLGMGYSQRLDRPRTFAQRIDDLTAVSDALGVSGPVVTVGHDWGGAISLGWALAHRDRLRAVVLANTAVHQPADSAAPTLIRMARTPALRGPACTTTPTFVRVTGWLSRPALPADVRAALAAPYRGASRRRGVGEFVADIPLEPGHVSHDTLEQVEKGLTGLSDVPALLLWGPRDPVFSDRYLRDLLGRLPHADVHRYEGASHLVTEDAPRTAADAWRWISTLPPAPGVGTAPAATPSSATSATPQVPGVPGTTPSAPVRPVWAALQDRAGDPAPAVVELAGRPRTISFDLLERRVGELARGLVVAGVRPGDRVALLVPPGADLTAGVYACWRAGAVVVLADAGLGPSGLARALRGAGPDHVIGVPRGLALARALGIPGRRIAAGRVSTTAARLLGAPHRLVDLARTGAGSSAALPQPAPDTECAVLFTSGATGPAKGVVYRHEQLQAQLAALRALYRIGPGDRLVAAFAPFALFGPALGITSAAPDAPVPGELTAAALADAAAAVGATVVFASVAALRTVIATAAGLDGAQRAALGRVRLLVSAGAPVPAGVLRALREVLPGAEAHTPYGMTEVLPVTDATLADIEAAGPGNGVCVGRSLPGVLVGVSPLGHDGTATGPPTTEPGVTGEVCVRAAHVKQRYDRLWVTQDHSTDVDTTGTGVGGAGTSDGARWHRTGDVGHLDADGRLWIEGRLVHVVSTTGGPVTPIGVEQRVTDVDGVRAAAVVGVGPAGTQQVVVVVVAERATAHRAAPLLAGDALSAAVRAVAGIEVAAVLRTDALPVDVRHASKIDRARVAAWAGRVLAGGTAGRRP